MLLQRYRHTVQTLQPTNLLKLFSSKQLWLFFFFHWYISVNCPVIAWQLTETVYSSLFSDIMTELTQRKNHQWPLL